MTKSLPTSLTILGRKVKIKQGKNLVYEGKPCLGLCDYDNKTIYLEKLQGEESKQDTLCHESLHFFLILLGIDQKLTEAECEIYCQSFTALFRDLKEIL
jgi:hypothetical protein